jgi:hypothetical protein
VSESKLYYNLIYAHLQNREVDYRVIIRREIIVIHSHLGNTSSSLLSMLHYYQSHCYINNLITKQCHSFTRPIEIQSTVWSECTSIQSSIYLSIISSIKSLISCEVFYLSIICRFSLLLASSHITRTLHAAATSPLSSLHTPTPLLKQHHCCCYHCRQCSLIGTGTRLSFAF